MCLMWEEREPSQDPKVNHLETAVHADSFLQPYPLNIHLPLELNRPATALT